MDIDRYALFGHPVALSLSPKIHQQFADSLQQYLVYDKVDVLAEDFLLAVSQFFESGGKGLNITVPHKESAFLLADVVSENAKIAGAANTLWMKNFQIYADNTDGIGFIEDIERLQVTLKNKKILVLGAGGAVRGILAPLLKHDPEQVVIHNRTHAKAQQLVDKFSQFGQVTAATMAQLTTFKFDMIINGLSLHQFPDIPLNINTDAAYYDLKYGNSAESGICWAQDQGFNIIADGWGMLVSQAGASYNIWHQTKPLLNEVIKWGS